MNQNLKAAYQYQLADHKRPILIFYMILLAVLALMIVGAVSVNASSSRTMIGGLDFATAIFVFVAGLCNFKEPFLMLLQNGVSRKSVFAARLLVSLTVAGILAVIDKFILLLGKAILHLGDNAQFFSFFEQVYAGGLARNNAVLLHVKLLVLDFLMYLALLAAGYFITIVFYRLGKAGKVAVGAGVPVGLTIVLPIVDSMLFDSAISYAFGRFLDAAFGLTASNPYAAMVTFVLTFALFSCLAWLLMRRAVIKP